MNAGTLIPFAASTLAFAAVLLLALGLRNARRGSAHSAQLQGKIARLGGGSLYQTGHPAPMTQMSQRVQRLFQGLGRFLGPKGQEDVDQVRQSLMRAGLRKQNAALIFHGSKAVLALAPPVLFLGVALLLPKTPSTQVMVIGALALALAGNYLPNAWLRSKVAERRNQLLCELPDALDLLVVCVESGMGLDQAIHRVSEELMSTAPGICGELRTMTLEMRAGRQRQQSLKDLAERTGLEDVQSLVTLLIQADLFGISVARTLRVYSETLRTGRFQRAEEMAAKLPTKLMFPLIVCIFPALLVVIMGPAAIQLMQVFSRMGQ
ncbi:MAG: type II secretion system F family protein [Humidesulfovibrio sp.]|uniref:type II secretion system F family protein n=1 Tax=Humidesulfovibrio sp. TaxID=2910988 RepID=UPI0027352BB8|nr:type II secretion system F family protein [Humidesulfovibrio sp.]MDP2847427.1 type II secretion system F family protein [Humidesulfovibrio sp.]